MAEYDPDTWRVREENLRLARELRAEREQHHALRIEQASNEALQADDIDKPIVGEMLKSNNPRVVDGKVIVDFPGEEGLVGTPQELMQYMRDRPEQFGNIVGVQPKREPSKQELHLQKLSEMDMAKYMALRKRRPDHLSPE